MGDMKESMSLNGDGTFVCKLHPAGFIAETLSQSVTGTVEGTWKVAGTTINLTVTSAEDEKLKNTTASSTIVTLTENELTLKSDRGDTSTFHRLHNL